MFFMTEHTPADDAALNAIAHIPTEYLPKLVSPAFFRKLTDKDFMRIGTWLARKSYEEGGCPIGAVIIDNETRQIIGKGHNTLGQENDSTTHGETAALRDAGRVAKLQGRGPVDFRTATLYTTLTPCPVCCAQLCHRGHFARIVIGDVTNASSTESLLRQGGLQHIEIREDLMAVALYCEYAQRKPELHYLDWGGYKKLDEARESGKIPVKLS